MDSPDQTNILANQAEETIDLRKWIGKLLANWYWFVLSVIILGGGAYMYTKYQEPIYQVESTILIKDNQAIGAEALFNEFNFGYSGWYNDNEIQQLKSWTMAKRALEQLDFDISYVAVGKWSEKHLYENIPFRVIIGPDAEAFRDLPIYISILNDSTFQLKINGNHNIDLVHHFNVTFIYESLSFIISPNPNFKKESLPEFLRAGNYYFILNNLDKLASKYRTNLQAEWVNDNASVIKLNLSGHSAQKEVNYLNKLMDEYIDKSLEDKNKIATNTVEFIDKQLIGIVDSLKDAEENLSLFRSENQVINLTAEGQAIFEKMDKITQELALINMQVRYYEYLLNYLKNSKDFSDVMAPSTMGIDDQMLSSLISKLVELSSRKASLEYSATEDFQALTMVNLEIENNREALMENVRNILNTTKLTQADINRRSKQLTNEIKKLPETERKLLNIQRRFSMADEIYTFLSQRRAEAAIAEASNVPNQMVVDQARVDSAVRVSPKSKMNYAIGILLGLILPFLVLVIKDFLNTQISTRDDVENRTSVPVIGTVGHYSHKEAIPVIERSRSSIAESFRAIRTDLQFLLYKDNKKVIMVTSTISGEGKSFISLNLAGIFSAGKKKVVVVGMDLRKPVIHKHMALDNKIGVTTFLIGKSKFEEILFPSGHENLFYIPSGPVPPNPAELIETPEFAGFIEDLKSRFDIIILDTPPVALVTDASLIAKHSDANLYIVRQDYTKKSVITFIDKFAAKEHINNLNIIINDVRVPKYYGYSYGYGYGYGYGKGSGSGYYSDDNLKTEGTKP